MVAKMSSKHINQQDPQMNQSYHPKLNSLLLLLKDNYLLHPDKDQLRILYL